MQRAASLLAAGAVGFILGLVVALLWLRATPENQAAELRDSAAATTSAHSAVTPMAAPDTEAKRELVPTSTSVPSASISIEGSSIASAGVLVFGTLIDPQAQPIRGAHWASVSFADHAGRSRFVDAKEGAYAISGLASGTYYVSVRASGYRTHDETMDLTTTQSPLRKDFTLQKSVVLKVKAITPEGKPLLPALREAKASRFDWEIVPVATKDPPGNHVYEVVGSLNNPFGVGQFWQGGPLAEKLTPEYMGILLLDGDLPVSVSLVMCHAVLQTKLVEPGSDEVVFVLSPEQVQANLTHMRVKVVDAETEQPIVGAEVSLSGGPNGGGSAMTSSLGVAAIENEMPGRFALRIGKEGYESLHKMTDVEPSVLTDLGTVSLEKEVTVQGRFLDAQGAPIAASFQLGLLQPGVRSIDWAAEMGGSSDATGSFTIKSLGRKQYVLRTNNHDAAYDGERAVNANVSGDTIINTRAGSIQGLVIRLRSGSMLVLRVKGGSATGLRFRVLDEQGMSLVEDRFWNSAPRPLRLPPGSYRVGLLDSKQKVLSESPVALGAGMMEVELSQ